MQNLSVYYMHLLDKMDDIDTESKHLFWNCFEKVSSVDEKSDKLWTFVFKNEYIADEKSEYLLFEMSGNGADEKSRNLFLK